MTENGSPLDRAESRMQKADAAIDAKALGALAGDAGIPSAYLDEPMRNTRTANMVVLVDTFVPQAAALAAAFSNTQIGEDLLPEMEVLASKCGSAKTLRDWALALKPQVARLHAILQQIERKDE